MIDIGAQSTRPNATLIKSEEEYMRLESVLEGLQEFIKEDMCVSIDSFVPEVILKILKKFSISWINDVSGNLDTVGQSHARNLA